MESWTMKHEGFPPRILLMLNFHRISFPTCMSHPENIHLHCSIVHQLLHTPSRASSTCRIINSQSSVVASRLPPGEITSPTTSLTWRDFLTDLTTCFFFPKKLSHLKRVSHRPDNLLLQSTVLTTRLFTSTPSQPKIDSVEGSNRN